MAFKRPGSSIYQVRRRNLPGFGDTGQITSGVRDKRAAERMERCLEAVAALALSEPRYRALLEAVRDKHLPLADLLRAHSERRLDALAASMTDPPLSDAAAEMRPEADRSVLCGLDKLLVAYGQRARLSDLTDAPRLQRILEQVQRKGMHRNSVRRQVLRAASLLLRRHYGKAERDRILAGVDFPAIDDTREVHITPAEVTRLRTAAADLGYDELSTIILTALLTGADRGVLLSGEADNGRQLRGLLVRDVEIYEEPDGAYSGEMKLLHDTKTSSRGRTVAFGDRLARELLLLVRDRDGEEPVFQTTYRQLDIRWKRTRTKAKLENVRFKDLRAQYAIYAEKANVPLTAVQGSMGHASSAMTRRYQRHAASMSAAQVAAIEREMLAT